MKLRNLFKKKTKEKEVVKYYSNDLEEIDDWENYYGENYGACWL